MRKIIYTIILCITIFWMFRIYRINQIPNRIICQDMQTDIEREGISVRATEAHLYTVKEYSENFNVSVDDLYYLTDSDTDDMIICVCLEATNHSGKDLSWDTLIEKTECGFETTTWGSSIDPMIVGRMNSFTEENFKNQSSQKIWYATNISSACFKKENWKHIRDYSFYYVLALFPEKIEIKLRV